MCSHQSIKVDISSERCHGLAIIVLRVELVYLDKQLWHVLDLSHQSDSLLSSEVGSVGIDQLNLDLTSQLLKVQTKSVTVWHLLA